MSKLVLIMGVSGGGKTTVLNQSGIMNDERFVYVPSYTTRPMRPGEINGQKYHHIDHAEFESAIRDEEFLEYALVHKMHYYGTKLSTIVDVLHTGKHAIKELDMHGLIKIQERTTLPFEVVSVFLDIPNSLMIHRINERGVLSAHELSERIASADFERTEAQNRCNVMIDATQPLENVIQTFIQAVNTLID